MSKISILIGIDLQEDFVRGSLGSEAAQKIIPNVIKKLDETNSDFIILTRDTHTDDYLLTKEGEKLPVKHCIYGSDGWKLCKEIEEWSEKSFSNHGTPIITLNKPTFGSVEGMFGAMSIVDTIKTLMKNRNADEVNIEIFGIESDICVISNALILKAFFYDNAEITVDSSCCAGVTPEKHEAALEVMRSCQINVK